MLRSLVLVCALIGAPYMALGQNYPEPTDDYVNDQGFLLGDAAEADLRDKLAALRRETGIHATVLTLTTRWGWEKSSGIEEFATSLFNHWGIGDSARNDGILILVASEDREMRIELGKGYGKGYDSVAQDVIDTVFLPAFKNSDFESGILAGSAAVIARIARPFAEGQPAPETGSGSGGSGAGLGAWLAGGLFAVIFAVMAFGQRLRDRFTRCPKCGERGMHTDRHVLVSATRRSTGTGEKTVTCPHCDYTATTTYTIARRSSRSSSSSGFGGGSSSGGGASGRW